MQKVLAPQVYVRVQQGDLDGGIALKAGGDIQLRAADLQAAGALSAQAGNNLNITTGVAALKIDEARQHMDTGSLNKSLANMCIGGDQGIAAILERG